MEIIKYNMYNIPKPHRCISEEEYRELEIEQYNAMGYVSMREYGACRNQQVIDKEYTRWYKVYTEGLFVIAD